MQGYMLALAALLFVIAVLALWLSAKQRRSAGLPGGRILSSDTGRWKKVEKPLFDPLSGLTGRPDYLVEENGALIPVEVKSSRAPDFPHDSHIYQLAAYCLLVERTYARRPPNGILRYRDRTFSIAYTDELQRGLETILSEMRSHEKHAGCSRSHEEPARCARCGYRAICDQRL